MKILLLSRGNVPVCFVCVPAYPENYVRGRLGDHEILTFGFNEGVDIKICPEENFSEVIGRLPEGWNPDLCILWNVEWYLLPEGIENAPCPVIVVEMDWDYDIPLSRTIVQSADLVVTIGDFEKESVYALGATDVEIFYSQGIMEDYIPSNPVKIRERQYDIYYSTLFIDDINHPDRSRWILRLCDLADKYRVFIGANPDHSGYIEDLRKAKLVFSYHRYGSMSSRFLDAAAQGAVLIEPGTEVKKYFDPDREYISVNEDNMAEEIEKYLSNPEKLQEMSDTVYNKVRKDYDARHRFVGLIEFAGNYLQNKKSVRPLQRLSPAEMALRRGEVYYYSCYRANIRDFFVNIDIDHFLKLSIREFKKATSLDPSPGPMTTLAVALSSYGSLLQKLGKIDAGEEKNKEAISILEKIILDHPSYVMAWFNKGLIYLRSGSYREAEDIFKRTLKLLEDNSIDIDPWVLQNRDFELFNDLLRRHLNQNLLLLCKGDRKGAMENIRKLYQGVIHYFISLLEEQNGRIYESLEHLVESYNLCPESGSIAKNLARKLAILGFKKEGLDLYRKVFELFPLEVESRHEYIKLLYAYNMDKEAIEEIKRTFKIYKTVSHRKECLSELNKIVHGFNRLNNTHPFLYDQAKESYLNEWIEELYHWLTKNPGDLRIVLRIIELFVETGRIDKAGEVLNDYIRENGSSLNDEEVMAIRDSYVFIKESFNVSTDYIEESLKRLEASIDSM